MKSTSFYDAMQQWEVKYKNQVMESTWGHLAPQKNKTYRGWINFCWASDGTLCPIDYDFENLPGSPWLYDAIIDFISKNAKEQGKIYRFEGVVKNYAFVGKIKMIGT